MPSCTKNYNCKPPSLFERITQKSNPELTDHNLKKCLNLFDLTVQGLAHIIGVGIFIMTPGVIKMVAGPGLVVSYLLAAAVIVFTVVSYMDLGARYRGIGNAYVYVYASLGEFAAGLTGTFIMIEISLCLAFVAVGFGQNFDKYISDGYAHELQVKYSGTFLPDYLAENVNLMAIALIIVCCVINCIGVKQVAITNTITVGVSLLTLAMYCVISLIYGSTSTFTDSTDPDTGRGGLFPYGISGVVTGAAITVVSFAGFETLVSLSAEAKNSKRDVPLAVGLSFGISTVVYVCVTAAICYLVPWYTLTESTGIAASLEAHKLPIPKYIVIFTILLASASVALCTLTTLARGLMVISEDGLMFKFLSSVAECSKVPVAATVTASSVIIFFTLVFSYKILIHLVSGGTLVTFVAVCFTLVVISYSKTKEVVDESTGLVPNVPVESSEDAGYVEGQEWKIVGLMGVYTKLWSFGILLVHLLKSWSFWHVRFPILVVTGIIGLLILTYIKLNYHIQPQRDPGFVCPGIPFVPAIGITLNLALFSVLDVTAHLMTIAYFGFGTAMYFGYGYFHSTITLRKQKELELTQNDENDEVVRS
ncbi:hypothetical protein ACHWQZ_G003758 [Mnemiopsis leidyi]